MIIPSRRISEIEEKIKKTENLIVLSQITKNKKLTFLILDNIEKIVLEIIDLYPIKEKVSKSEEVKEILKASEEHKKSDMEFYKNDEIIILSEEQEINRISQKKLNEFMNTAKKLLYKIKQI